MKFSKVRIACRKLNVRHDPKCYNVLRYHNKNETRLHWMVKAALFFDLVHKRGKSIYSELNVDGNVADLFVLDDNLVIEVQTMVTSDIRRKKCSQFLKRNVWVIPVKDFARDFEHALEYWLERMGV